MACRRRQAGVTSMKSPVPTRVGTPPYSPIFGWSLMLSIQEVQALLRACQADTGQRPYSKTAQRLVDSLGFGRIVGKHWLVADADRDRIRAYLQSVEDIDATTPPDAWLGRNRIDATQLGRNE